MTACCRKKAANPKTRANLKDPSPWHDRLGHQVSRQENARLPDFAPVRKLRPVEIPRSESIEDNLVQVVPAWNRVSLSAHAEMNSNKDGLLLE